MKTYATKIWHVSGFGRQKRAIDVKNCSDRRIILLKKLSYPDSNQDKQNQNLLCYHYTIGQSFLLSFEERCKGSAFERKCQTFKVVFDYGVDWGCLPVGFCVPLSVVSFISGNCSCTR